MMYFVDGVFEGITVKMVATKKKNAGEVGIYFLGIIKRSLWQYSR